MATPELPRSQQHWASWWHMHVHICARAHGHCAHAQAAHSSREVHLRGARRPGPGIGWLSGKRCVEAACVLRYDPAFQGWHRDRREHLRLECVLTPVPHLKATGINPETFPLDHARSTLPGPFGTVSRNVPSAPPGSVLHIRCVTSSSGALLANALIQRTAHCISFLRPSIAFHGTRRHGKATWQSGSSVTGERRRGPCSWLLGVRRHRDMRPWGGGGGIELPT